MEKFRRILRIVLALLYMLCGRSHKSDDRSHHQEPSDIPKVPVEVIRKNPLE